MASPAPTAAARLRSEASISPEPCRLAAATLPAPPRRSRVPPAPLTPPPLPKHAAVDLSCASDPPLPNAQLLPKTVAEIAQLLLSSARSMQQGAMAAAPTHEAVKQAQLVLISLVQVSAHALTFAPTQAAATAVERVGREGRGCPHAPTSLPSASSHTQPPANHPLLPLPRRPSSASSPSLRLPGS